jgi:hypothetical protein
MVYNSTNINKKNTKHLILAYLTEHKKTMTYDVGNPGPGVGQAQHLAALSRLIRSQPSPLKTCNWISMGLPIYTNDTFSAQILFHSKRPHIIAKIIKFTVLK